MLLDGKLDWVVSAQESPSTQGYTSFEGMELSARVKQTWLRGSTVAWMTSSPCGNGPPSP